MDDLRGAAHAASQNAGDSGRVNLDSLAITPTSTTSFPAASTALTSTGYGAGLEGVTALLAMHASCAAGITVVGIDNGFGAACAVARMFPA